MLLTVHTHGEIYTVHECMIVVVMLISTELSQVKAVGQYDHSKIQSSVILSLLMIRENCSLNGWIFRASQEIKFTTNVHFLQFKQ